jgi:putative addiction module component (TIGR02574 family)
MIASSSCFPVLIADRTPAIVLRMNALLAPILQLSRQEKLQLVEELWDSIAQEESQQPLAQWKVDELIRREEAYKKDPSTALSWEEVRASIQRRHA